METKNIIKNLGLTEQETEIYLSLLKMGDLMASRIASIIGVKRTTIYPILQNLVQKGFIRVVYKTNLRHYQAVNPGNLSSYFERRIEEFNSIIPLLQSFDKKQVATEGVRFIDTIRELEMLYESIIDEYKGRSYSALTNIEVWENIGSEYFRDFRYRRAEANIKIRLLATNSSKKINPKDKKLLREVRFLPKKYYFESNLEILDDKIIIMNSKVNSIALVISIPAIVDVFKSIFEFMWDSSK